MVFFNCSANGLAARGTECEKSCNTLDMACVSHFYFNMKRTRKYGLSKYFLYILTDNVNFCVKFQNCLYWSKNETIDLLRFDLFSRWLQDVFQAVCVHLGWCLTVREVASSQRPVPVFTMASLTSLERPLRWTATPGKWIKQGIKSFILEWGSLDWFEKSFCIVLCAGWHCCDPSSSIWLFLSNVTSPHFTSVNTNNLDLRSFFIAWSYNIAKYLNILNYKLIHTDRFFRIQSPIEKLCKLLNSFGYHWMCNKNVDTKRFFFFLY